MPLELRYRGDVYRVAAPCGRFGAPPAPLEWIDDRAVARAALDWRLAGARIRRVRRRQAAVLAGVCAASVAGPAAVLEAGGPPGAGETAAVALTAAVVGAGAAGWAWLGTSMGRAVAALELAAGTLADLAATDPLTELPNHRAFHERLAEEVERAGRTGRPLSLVLLDLDHFKGINDRHGHPAGDAVVREVAARLAAAARRGEVVARVGGEEFAWLLPGADAMDAWQAAERARLAVAATPVLGDERVTVSAGVCELSQAGAAGELHRLADGALDWAKAHGRDRCIRYSPEVVAELSAHERAARLERQQALNAIHALARAVDAKDAYTRRHSERVADIAAQLALALGWDAGRIEALREAAVLHDVGKIAVPDAILQKPSGLTADEMELVRGHAARGAEIVAGALSHEQVRWVRGHHERFDGGGYPDGIAGEALPDGARVLALADAWDAMTSDRPYRPGLPAAAALGVCRAESGRQFAPEVVDALTTLWARGAVPHSDPEPVAEPAALVYRGAEAVPVPRREQRSGAGEGLVYRGLRVPRRPADDA